MAVYIIHMGIRSRKLVTSTKLEDVVEPKVHSFERKIRQQGKKGYWKRSLEFPRW